MATQLPKESSLSRYVTESKVEVQHHNQSLEDLSLQVQYNLKNQHNWTEVREYVRSPQDDAPLSRPIIAGRPPRRVYIHPDELLEFIKVDVKDEDIPTQSEWVVPSHIQEKWTLRDFAQIFDKIGAIPPVIQSETEVFSVNIAEDAKWREAKRILLATVDDDSTVVYYVVHDGLVKPRQN